MEKRIIKDMTDYLGITARVKLVEPNTLKAGAKIIDKRHY
jgi:phenylacetate-CoA ligase